VKIGPLPVAAQPGQAPGTIGLAVGYGKEVWKLKEKIGVDAYPLTSFVNDAVSYEAYNVEISDVAGCYHLAATQTHHTIMGRDSIVKEVDLNTYKTAGREAYNPAMA